MNKKYLQQILFFFTIFTLVGCSGGLFTEKGKASLKGERISVLELEKTLEPDDINLENQGFIAPAPWKNSFWPQAGGYPNHSMQNLSLNDEALKKVWSVDIGKGSTDELPLTAQPVLVDGQIFTMDTKATLSAFNVKNGKLNWRIDVSNPKEDDPVIGGGIAYATGVLYVCNGFDEILAIQPANGDILWRKPIPAPSRAAPTVIDGRIFIVTLDNRLVALRANDGLPLWTYSGINETTTIIGAASPAANNDIVVAAFSSGELTALRVENGSMAWTDNLSSSRGLGALESLSDIKALPIIDKGLIFAASFSDRMVAIDERTGSRIWQREIGTANTPWVAGNSIFILTSDNTLVSLGRDTGSVRWVTRIGEVMETPLILTGPIYAGGRLILAGTDGIMLEVNAETGDIIRQWDSGEDIITPPIVAGNALYLLSEDGTLSAYQ